MAKQAYVYSGTDWVPLASEVTNLSSYYTSAQTDIITAPTGLKLLVPTSVAVGSGTGTVGSTGTVTFTGASSVSLNGVFSATYTNYRIVYNIEHSVGLVVASIRMRVSGTDATGANYNYQSLSADNAISGGRSQNQTSSEFALISISVGNNGSTDIYRPFLANPTQFISTVISTFNSPYGRIYWAEHTPSTSYDGFTLFPSSGTMTGTVSVYGYTK